MITPIELHNRQHKTGRGYKKKEMDIFLEEVFESYEQLYKENIELKDKISRLSDGVQQYKTMETALQKALVLAEKTSKDTIESASHKAAVIEKEAGLKATTIVNNALNKSDEIKKQCILLLKQYNQFKAQYKQIALKQIELLDGDFYEIYSKDLIDAVNDASKSDEDENKDAASDNTTDNTTENITSQTEIAARQILSKTKKEAGNTNQAYDAAEAGISLTNHIERAIKIGSDMTDAKEITHKKGAPQVNFAVNQNDEVRFDVPNGDTKEFTPLETEAIGRAAKGSENAEDTNKTINVKEEDGTKTDIGSKTDSIRTTESIRTTDSTKKSEDDNKEFGAKNVEDDNKEYGAKNLDGDYKEFGIKNVDSNNKEYGTKNVDSNNKEYGTKNVESNNKEYSTTILDDDNKKDGVKKSEDNPKDYNEKLDRSIRKLRSELANERKSSKTSSSFEFFDNE